MGNEDLIKLTDIKSNAIRKIASDYDEKRDRSGGINRLEAAYLQGYLMGKGISESDFANESDEVKATFGYHTSPISTTSPSTTKKEKEEINTQAEKHTTTLSEKDRKKIEKEVAREVKALAKQGKTAEQILNALYRMHAQIVTVGDVKKEPKKYTTDDIGDFKYELNEDGERELLLKPGYEEVIADVEIIKDMVDESGASHQYSLLGIRTQKRYVIGCKRQNKEYGEVKDDIKEEYSDSTKKFRNATLNAMELGLERERANDYLETTHLKDKDGNDINVVITYTYKDKDGKSVTVTKRAATMIQHYENLIEMDRLQNPNGVPNFEKNLKAVKDVLEENNQWLDYDCKQAYDLLKERAKSDARMEARGDIGADNDNKSYKKIRKNLRKNSKDDYYRDAIQDLKQVRKNKANKNKFDSNLPTISSMTYDEVADELSRHFIGIRTKNGSKTTDKLDAYLTNGQNTYAKDDNNYDLQQLALGILSRVGFDYTMSRNDDDLQMSEIKNVKEYLKTRTNEDFSDDEIKRLCKLSAIVVEGKDRSVKAILSKLSLGALAGGIGVLGTALGTDKALDAVQSIPQVMRALLAGIKPLDALQLGINSVSLSNGTSSVSKAEIEQFLDTQKDEIRKIIDEKGSEEAKKYVQNICKEKFGVTEALQIIIQRIKYDPAEFARKYDNEWLNKLCEFYKEMTSDAIKDAAKTEYIADVIAALVPALITLAFGDPKNEESCVSVSDYAITEKKYTDVNKFKDYVDQRFGHNEEKARAIKMLADICNKVSQQKNCKYEWHEIFNDMVREIAGYGSKLNWAECLGFQDQKFDFSKYIGKVTVNNDEKDDGCGTGKCIGVKEETKGFNAEPHTEKYTGWADAINGYSCLKSYDRSVKDTNLGRRMIKVIQAMTVDHIKSADEFRKFYDITKIAAFAEETINKGIDSAIAKYPELHVNKQEYLAVLNSEIGVKEVILPELYDPNHEEGDDGLCNWIKPNHTPVILGGKGNVVVVSRKETKTDGSVAYYQICYDAAGKETGRTPIDEKTYDRLPHSLQ